MPQPNTKLKDLEWVQFHIQDQKKGGCGQYSLLWIYYIMIGEEDKFYNMCVGIIGKLKQKQWKEIKRR